MIRAEILVLEPGDPATVVALTDREGSATGLVDPIAGHAFPLPSVAVVAERAQAAAASRPSFEELENG